MNAFASSWRIEHVRAVSWAIGVGMVAALLGLALWSRYPAYRDAAPASAIEAIFERPSVAQQSASPRVARVTPNAVSSPTPMSTSSPAAAPMLAALRCATQAGRRENAALCHGVADARGRAREIAIAPVEGVLSHDDDLQRSLLRSLNGRVRNYATGEAQRYIDPREDPIFEEGTDPATAAMRPCPAGTETRGTGAGLTGRTCQMGR